MQVSTNTSISADDPHTYDRECYYPLDTSNRLVTAIFLYLFFIVGSIGNAVVILAIAFKRSLWKPSNMYILCLVSSDFITSAVICPFQAEVIRVGCALPGCDFIGILIIFTLIVGANSLAAIAINRFLLIKLTPDRYFQMYSNKRTAFSIVLIFLIALVSIIAGILGGALIPGYYPKSGFCTPSKMATTEAQAIAAYIFALTMIGGMGFPIFIIVVACYVGVWIMFRNSSKASQRNPSQQATAKRFKLTRNLFLLTAVFGLCWLPDFVTEMIDSTFQFTGPWMKIAYMLLWANGVLNPFLYALMSDQFRKAYKNVFLCRVTCKESVHPSQQTESSGTM